MKKHSHRDALGFRPIDPETGQAKSFQFLTFEEVRKNVNSLACAIKKELGLKESDLVAIYAKNRLEWILTEWASMSRSIPTVALYDTFGKENIKYVLNHSEAKAIFSSIDRVENLLPLIEDCKYVKHIICFDPLTSKKKKEFNKVFKKLDIKLHDFSEILKKYEGMKSKDIVPGPKDLYTIMYTSGTTGNPKGVMITHNNVVATCAGVSSMLDGIREDDIYLSYLPLAHILERVAFTCLFINGAKIGFYQGDVTKLVDDIQDLKPTVMTGVPRVFNRIHSRIIDTIESGGFIKRALFSRAYKSKKEALMKGKKPSGFWEKIVFSKIKARLGGRLRIILSGGAPLPPVTQEFVQICIAPIVQGYGLTETTAGGTVTYPDDLHFGEVGVPKLCCEVKLVDVPELEYTVKDKPNPRGEIWIRGPNISIGYYKDEEKTKEDFDEDGYFHTGDIGELTERGTIKIIDRKKNIFKLGQGEYVAAEELENVYIKSRFVEQIWVYGDSQQNFLVAIVFPKLENLRDALNLPKGTSIEEIVKSDEANRIVLQDLERIAKESGRQGFEFIKALHLSEHDFNPENDLATPTMKLKRPQLKAYFIDEIDRMYESLNKDERKTLKMISDNKNTSKNADKKKKTSKTNLNKNTNDENGEKKQIKKKDSKAIKEASSEETKKSPKKKDDKKVKEAEKSEEKEIKESEEENVEKSKDKSDTESEEKSQEKSESEENESSEKKSSDSEDETSSE